MLDADDTGSELVTLDDSGSSDSDGSIDTYSWTESGTEIATGVNPVVDLDVGVHTITLTVTDNGGATGIDTQEVTVGGGVEAMHVGDLDGSARVWSNFWRATVTITVHDASQNPVADAMVGGSWGNGDTGSCVTDSSGTCSITSAKLDIGVGAIFTVQDVPHATLSYDPAGNHDPDGDSNGTTIAIHPF